LRSPFQVRLDHVPGDARRVLHKVFDIERLDELLGQDALQEGLDKHLSGFEVVLRHHGRCNLFEGLLRDHFVIFCDLFIEDVIDLHEIDTLCRQGVLHGVRIGVFVQGRDDLQENANVVLVHPLFKGDGLDPRLLEVRDDATYIHARIERLLVDEELSLVENENQGRNVFQQRLQCLVDLFDRLDHVGMGGVVHGGPVEGQGDISPELHQLVFNGLGRRHGSSSRPRLRAGAYGILSGPL